MAKFYLNYVTDYGDAPSQVSVDVADGASFTFAEEHLPTLSVDGYQFEGWLLIGALVSAGHVITDIDGDMVFTLIAKWSKEPNICGNATGGFGVPKSFVIVDENGNEFTGVTTDEVTVFDATPADVRINKTFASENGILTGENTITYRTTKGRQLIETGATFSIPLSDYDKYNYTKLQCIIAPFNTTIDDSVVVDKIVLDDYVYSAGSSIKISDVVKNSETKSIDLNITNNSDNIYFIYYFTYMEDY